MNNNGKMRFVTVWVPDVAGLSVHEKDPLSRIGIKSIKVRRKVRCLCTDGVNMHHAKNYHPEDRYEFLSGMDKVCPECKAYLYVKI